ncbi:hypothetical protein [[Kitasatospora] papulosa]|uniref:hypothetical protein n=1 Tax=[Kitasatospora] papulosa TaxID=1464011 RepID=UPI003698BDD1
MTGHIVAGLRYEHQPCARCTSTPIPEVRSIGDIDLASMMIKATTDPDCPDCHGRRTHLTERAKVAQGTHDRLFAERCTRTFADVQNGTQVLYKATARKSDTRQTWQTVTEITCDGDRVLFRTDARRGKNPLTASATDTVLVYPQDGTPRDVMRETARLHPDAVTFHERGRSDH